jgi:hypothetical protein
MSIKLNGPAANPGFRTEWWTPRLAGPLIAAAAIRFTLLAVALYRGGIENLIDSDTSSYLEPGRNLLLHGRFYADGVPDLVRTPGYPLFLAITSLGGMPSTAVIQVILSVFSVLLVWKLGRTAFGDERIALIAAWIFAFEPISIIFSVDLLSETLFLALLLLSMERIAEFLRGRSLRVLAMAGLWLTAATFVRPVTYYLPFALAVGLFIVLARVPGLRWKAPAVLLISVLPWLVAWQIRNKIETGYSGFTSAMELNLYFYDAAGVIARIENRDLFDVNKELGIIRFTNNSQQFYLYPPYLALHPEQAGWNQGQRLAFMRSEAMRIIRAHYGVFLHECLRSFFRIIFEPGAGLYYGLLYPDAPNHVIGLARDKGIAREMIELANAYPWVAVEKAAFAVVLLGLYLFAARGILRVGMHNACVWLLLGISLYFIAISTMAGVQNAGARFRLPIMPFVCILAAAGVRSTKALARGKCARDFPAGNEVTSRESKRT